MFWGVLAINVILNKFILLGKVFCGHMNEECNVHSCLAQHLSSLFPYSLYFTPRRCNQYGRAMWDRVYFNIFFFCIWLIRQNLQNFLFRSNYPNVLPRLFALSFVTRFTLSPNTNLNFHFLNDRVPMIFCITNRSQWL